MKKKYFGFVGLLVAVVVLGLFYSSLQSSSEEDKSVKIGYLNIVASLPLFVAEEKGFLKDEGIEFESIPMATSNQLVDGVLSGNLDCFIESSAVPVLAAELQSAGKMKIFAASEITSTTPFDALLVKTDSPIKSLSDLTEKKIGVFPGSTATNLLKKYLSDKGLDVSKIMFIPIPPPTQLPALIKGSIDALHAYEPTAAIALTQGEARQLYGSIYAEMISPNPQGVAVANSNFLEKYPKISSKVIKALERAMVFMKEHDKETRQILINRMKLSQEVVNRCALLYMLPHRQINVPVFQEYADMLTGIGELSGKANVKNLVYND